MKRLAILLTASMMILFACNSKPKNTITISGDGKEKITIDANQMQNAAENMQKEKDELSKLTPLSLDQLKALIPENLMGAKRKNFVANSAMGAGLAQGDYEMNDSTNVKLNIYDCGGPAGAGIYSLQYLGLMNIQQESDEEYTKTIDFKGGKAYEHCNKSSNDCTLTWFTGGRFLVTLDGNNVTADALKQAAGELNIK